MGFSIPNPLDAAKNAYHATEHAVTTVVSKTEDVVSTGVNATESAAVKSFQFGANVTRAGIEKTWDGIQAAGKLAEKTFDKVTHPGSSNPPAAQGLEFSETKDASDLAYKANQGESYKFVNGEHWRVVDVQNDSNTGFRAVALQSADPTDHRVIVAFAGTSGSLTGPDWQTDFKQAAGLPTGQYQEAVDFANKWKATDGNNVILTGHSLGGGLASYAALKTNLHATAVNAAPLALDHLSINPADYMRVTQYYVPGEALSVVNKANPLDVRPGVNIPVEGRNSIFDPRSIGSNHSLANVAPDVDLPTLDK